MIDKIIAFSIHQKLIIFLCILVLLFSGIYSLLNLPIDAVPDITNNQVQIITSSPNLAAQEIERSITAPIEQVMITLPALNEIRSISRFGLSVITIVFEEDVEIERARQMVSERLIRAKEEIPAGLASPTLGPITTGLGEIYQYTIEEIPGSNKKYNLMDLRTIQDWIVKRQLSGVKGIAEVSSFGGHLKQYEISLDPNKLRSFNVSIHEIYKALENNNQNTGGAYIDKKPNSYYIRSIGLIGQLSDIENICIRNTNGVPLLIKQIAKVQFGSSIRFGALVNDDQGEAVGGLVLMLKGENADDVIKRVKIKIQEINKTLPPGLRIVPFLDRSKLVSKAIETVITNLTEGCIIVIFILVLLLGNIRAGFIVASVIPLSMLFTVTMMHLFKISGNLMSLGAIDFGLIVDGAVIIVEAIIVRLSFHLHHASPITTTESTEDAVFSATSQIRKSAAFGEIIIMIVYLPILSLVGIEGKMFRPMAQTVIFAILGALILSLTYVPMMSALLLKRSNNFKTHFFDNVLEWIHVRYIPVIRYSLSKKKIILFFTIAVILVSFYLFSKMGGEFIPTLEEGDFAVETLLLPGSSLSQTIETSERAAKILKDNFPEVLKVVGKVGTSEIPTDPMPIESCDLIIILKDSKDWTTAKTREMLAEKMNEKLSSIPGVSFSFQQPIQMRFNELMTGSKQDIAISIYGDDMKFLQEASEKVAHIAGKIKGAGDVFTERVSGLPQIIIEYNREKMSQYGLNIADINDVIRTSYAGEVAGFVYEGEKKFELVVRLEEQYRNDLEAIKNVQVSLPSGHQIPISQIADIRFETGPMQISRDNARRKITVGVNVRNRDIESFVKEVQEKIGNLKLYPGYYVTYGGQFENLVKARSRLLLVVPISLFFILLLLYTTFRSWKDTVIIFTAVPFAAVGGILALAFTGMPFSISAGVGFIALFGVAVLNGIVLISYLNQLEKEGVMNINERIIKAMKLRLRPILITASVASFGFLPMALSNTAGAEVQKPLATVVIGGLLTSTLLTIFVLPLIYAVFHQPNSNGPKSSSLLFLIPVLILIVPGFASAQSNINQYDLNKVLELAMSVDPRLASGKLEISYAKTLKGTSVDLKPLQTMFSYGQYNSVSYDNSFSVSQTFSLPMVYSANFEWHNAHIKNNEIKLKIAERELVRETRVRFYEFVHALEKRKLLQLQDTLFKNFTHAADVRFNTGESTYLEKISANIKYQQIQNELLKNNLELKKSESYLKRMTQTQDSISLLYSSILFPEMIVDTALLPANIQLVQLKEEAKIAKAETKSERTRLYPELYLGYTNQTLQGNHIINNSERYYGMGARFQYVSIGLTIPLFFNAARARILSASIAERISQNRINTLKLSQELELIELLQQQKQLKNSKSFYEKNVLAQADLIIEYANKSYLHGEINYFEYLNALQESLKIKSDYLNIIHEVNNLNIKLAYYFEVVE